MNELPQLSINPNRIDIDEAYMQIAEVWAKRSKAVRKQVGAIIVKDRRIISDGHNGLPSGAKNDVCEYWWFERTELNAPTKYVLKSKPDVLHAESNSLMKISEQGGLGASGGTLYVTMSPCFECSKLIIQSRIARVVYREEYRDISGIHNLREYGVQVDKI